MTCSEKQWDLFNRHWKIHNWRRTRLMKLYWLVDLLEFQKLDN